MWAGFLSGQPALRSARCRAATAWSIEARILEPQINADKRKYMISIRVHLRLSAVPKFLLMTAANRQAGGNCPGFPVAVELL
jgi:hypothetical protein